MTRELYRPAILGNLCTSYFKLPSGSGSGSESVSILFVSILSGPPPIPMPTPNRTADYLCRGSLEAAAALVLVHNHPSGDPVPSAQDLSITKRLCEAGELVGVRVLDHVLIGRGPYVSIVDDGY